MPRGNVSQGIQEVGPPLAPRRQLPWLDTQAEQAEQGPSGCEGTRWMRVSERRRDYHMQRVLGL